MIYAPNQGANGNASLYSSTGYIWQDLREKPHLIAWAIIAGMLWAVANTLTVFAIRNVGLSIAFPLWNTNSLVGLLWGWLAQTRGCDTALQMAAIFLICFLALYRPRVCRGVE